MKVILSGGGTAGHINPALAIGKYIEACEPGSELLFVGRKGGMEDRLITREGYPMEYIEVEGLKRSLTPANFRVLQKLFRARRKCRKIIEAFQPDLVVGTGGYVCTPIVMEAAKMGIKTLIHEQNVVPGVAVKMLAPKASVTAISFEETKDFLSPKAHCVVSGNPLRESILSADPTAAKAAVCSDAKPLVLMFGGSLGAEHMNDALVEMLREGDIPFHLIAGTGEKHFEGIMKRLEGVDLPKHVELRPYLYNMDELLAAADLVVCRAGAVTIGELTALGKASVLVPSPYVAHNHQEKNARVLESKGAAKVLTEKDLSGESLRAAITSALADEAVLSSMQKAAKALGKREATRIIYEAVRAQ